MPGRRATGVCFFRLPFFAQAKKGDSLARRASESFSFNMTNQQQQLDSGFRPRRPRNDNGEKTSSFVEGERKLCVSVARKAKSYRRARATPLEIRNTRPE